MKQQFLGTVLWFNPDRNYGFIRRRDGCADVFVHISAVRAAGLKTLKGGQEVLFELARQKVVKRTNRKFVTVIEINAANISLVHNSPHPRR